jgi:N-acetylneuraminic acid mutarotase
MPEARNGHSACVYKGHMYVFGGRNNENKKLNDIWKYDIKTREWQEIQVVDRSTEPVERSGHSCDVYGQYMVIFGGLYELTKELNDLYLFDLINEVWIPIFMG